jgi:small subunit ribosomal protein S12
MPGEFGARKLKRNRDHFRWKKTKWKSRALRLWAKNPLQGAPMAKGIVLEKRSVEQKQPSSGLIKAVRVQLMKNNIQATAHVPGTGAIGKINEHDEVTITSLGGSQGGSKGSMAGIKFKVIAVNGVSLKEIVAGRKQKPAR